VIDRVVGEEGHDRFQVLAFEGLAKIVDDFFRFVGHDVVSS